MLLSVNNFNVILMFNIFVEHKNINWVLIASVNPVFCIDKTDLSAVKAIKNLPKTTGTKFKKNNNDFCNFFFQF